MKTEQYRISKMKYRNELKMIKKVTELCDNFKQFNICGTGVQEGVVIWYRQKKIFELIMATFSKFDDNY